MEAWYYGKTEEENLNRNIEEYMQEHQITEVLVLYNVKNFAEDKNLFKLER